VLLELTYTVGIDCLGILPGSLPDGESNNLVVNLFLHFFQVPQLNLRLDFLQLLHFMLV